MKPISLFAPSKLLLMCALFWFLAVFHTSAEERFSDRDYNFSEEYDSIISEVKELIIPNLTEKEQKIVRSISIRRDNDPRLGPMPVALIENNHRYIELSIAYYRIVLAVTESFMIEVHFGRAGFAAEYMAYALNKNDGRIKWPYVYAGIHVSDIAQMYQADGPAMEKVGLTMGAVAMVLCHEWAHHVLGHTAGDKPSLAVSRAQEERADAWAIQRLIESEILPLGAIPALYAFYMMDQNAIRHEKERTHPAELRRFDAAISATLGTWDRFVQNHSDRFEVMGVDPDAARVGLIKFRDEVRSVIAGQDSD
jgi:hypothetical protein